MRKDLESPMKQAAKAANPGLIYQRYLGKHQDPKSRTELLQATIQACKNPALAALYRLAFQRWIDSFNNATTKKQGFQTTARLLIGLGTATVLETGLAFHQSYGVPLIPGTALKGLASHYCHRVWGKKHAAFAKQQAHHKLLFGTTEDSGIISFHDAWLTPESLNQSLQHDVMTPHHPQWIHADAEPPSDFDSPIPISFLTVSGSFQLCLSWSGPKDAPEEKISAWLELALDLLKAALMEWGAGGKTSSGYGRMKAV